MAFKDFFSEKSSEYKKYRPDYPEELFELLASLSGDRQLAWDCATGSGQCAQGLTTYFTHIIATDGSANQIANAEPHHAIEYRVLPAEHTDFPSESFDLITVGQALHWFDTEPFFKEANRVLKKDGILAVWTYNLLEISAEIDQVIRDFYTNELALYWPPERIHVEDNYSNIHFPYRNQETYLFEMEKSWSLQQLLGYICSWSAVKINVARNGDSAIRTFSDKLASVWGNKACKRRIVWPLTLYAFNREQG